jgi:hypothetical protein
MAQGNEEKPVIQHAMYIGVSSPEIDGIGAHSRLVGPETVFYWRKRAEMSLLGDGSFVFQWLNVGRGISIDFRFANLVYQSTKSHSSIDELQYSDHQRSVFSFSRLFGGKGSLAGIEDTQHGSII